MAMKFCYQNQLMSCLQQLISSALLLMLLTSCSAQSVYYVTPTPNTPCPEEPCHTLSKYIADEFFNNLPVNTTMEFLPGNHTLEQTISVTNLTSLTLHGVSPSLPEITSRIVCTWPSGFIFIGITELYISSLAFISCGHNDSAAVKIISVQQSNVSNCSFHYSMNHSTLIPPNKNPGGGALYIQNSNVKLLGNIFQNNSASFGGVFYVVGSMLTVTNNTFQSNSAGNDGGVLYVVGSTLTVTDNTFQNNSANQGGVFSIRGGKLTVTDNAFQNNSATGNGGIFFVNHSNIIVIDNTFQSNIAAHSYGGVFHAIYCHFTVTDNTFQNNSAGHGGVLFVDVSKLTVTNNVFQNNFAAHHGGVFYLQYSNIIIDNNMFQSNSAIVRGGVFLVQFCHLIAITNNIFQNNFAHAGGVLRVTDSYLNFTGSIFQSNSASFGGVLCVICSTLDLKGSIFQKNVGTVLGGAILVHYTHSDCYKNLKTIMRMYENNTIDSNRAEYGGGIAALGMDSKLELVGNTTIKSCTAKYGGGLYAENTDITGNMILTNNLATEEGGGMYASRSIITFTGNTTIINNAATGGNGGGLLLSDQSQFYLQPNAHVYFINNSAKSSGGAIMVAERSPLEGLCIGTDFITGNCFFKISTMETHVNKDQCTPSGIKSVIHDLKVGIHFDNNCAEAGADLYGGSVDECKILNTADKVSYFNCSSLSGEVFDDITTSKLNISSNPLHICTCRDHRPDCTGSYHPEPVYPGGTLEIPVIAYGQRNGTTPAVIQVIDTLIDNGNIIPKNEYTQNTLNGCNTLKYTIQSSAENTTHEITLYARGPCPPTLNLTLKVSIKILQCPPGFQLSHDKPTCICAERLQQFTNTCLIDNRTLLRADNADFWVGYNQLRGLILHPYCPFDYCTSNNIYLAVNDSDKQCNYNRSGLLCGRCHDSLSLALGSSRCLQCSNFYLSLLVAFGFAGILLVISLLVLRLTVAAGTINGLIFYANIVAMNISILFQPQTTNVPIAKVLTVFIAWLNLDLGIETCFYNGMDAYVKTWLQFAFPLYIWFLIGIIIIGSYYSGRVAKVFGSNPIAVLATLFLLSYAKLLRTFIAVLSYTFLEYPNNSHIAVWLSDGNIKYLSGKHIPLFIAAMACLVFLFFPYTTLLIFSQWLQAKSGLKIFSCINSRYIKHFLDAYHAPYSNKHRYWTGLMLLLRFVLFLISAVKVLGDPSVNLLAIVSVTTLIPPTIFGFKVYKTWSIGLLETSFHLNLTILVVVTLYIRHSGGNQNAVTFTSVGIAFATFIGIVIYHCIQQIKGTRLWRRVCLRHDYMRVPPTDVDSGPEDPPGSPVNLFFVSGSAPTQTVVDICNSQLREPCMSINKL